MGITEREALKREQAATGPQLAVEAGEGTFRLVVVTPEREVLDQPVDSVVLPGLRGSIGVLPRHAPMVVALRPGVVKYRSGGTFRRLAIAGGFFEFAGDTATVLADAAELAGEVDPERARQALERARNRLRRPGPDVDAERARAAMERAIARLRAAERDGEREPH